MAVTLYILHILGYFKAAVFWGERQLFVDRWGLGEGAADDF